MRQIRKITLVLFALTFSLLACKKGGNSNPSNAEDCKFSEISYHSPTTKVYHAIYSQNKLTQLISSSDNVVYTYDVSNKLIRKEVFDNGSTQVKFKSDYTINPSGQTVEQRSYYYLNGNLEYDGKIEFTYSGRKLTEMKFTGSAGQDYGKIVYTWTGENITNYSTYGAFGVLGISYTITYDLTKQNAFSAAFENFIFIDLYGGYGIAKFFTLHPVIFLGANIVTSVTESYTGTVSNVTYTQGAQNLFSAVEMFGVLIWEFKYSCN